MDSRPITPEDEAALDRAIDATRDGDASHDDGDGDGLDEFAARLHGFASSGPALDETRIRRTLEAKLDSTPQRQSRMRLPSWFAIPAMNRGFAPAAAAVVVALLIGAGALMSTSGSASADFMDDVQALSTFTTTAVADGELNAEEFAEITELVGALLVAVSNPAALTGISPEALAAVVEALAAVQSVLADHDHDVGIAGGNGASDDLGLVSSAVLQAHAEGLVAAVNAACSGDRAETDGCKQAFDYAKASCRGLVESDRGHCRAELGGFGGAPGSLLSDKGLGEEKSEGAKPDDEDAPGARGEEKSKDAKPDDAGVNANAGGDDGDDSDEDDGDDGDGDDDGDGNNSGENASGRGRSGEATD